ncbi:MAG TPA: hypothetical protein VKH63_13995 [Candidatus Acidoferrum sp.]|nr:hypothetical protein [Candidatus Acidoferrum sp.]
MPSLTAKDRVSLCLFTFTDGRRCRTPRTGNHPHFCFYHAQKEARACAAESLAKDLACFFSGDYLSACDLSTALARLIPAVIRGDIKPRLARTVAYMFQTQLQAIHIAQHEYINAFGTDGWRKTIRTSVNANYDHRFPTTREPEPQQPATATLPQPTRPLANATADSRPSRHNSVTPQSAAPIPNPTAPKPVIPSVAKDTATILLHRPPTRPAFLPRLAKPNSPSIQLRPHHYPRNPNHLPQTATPMPSTSTTTSASASAESPSRISM